jgi:hypothetical protein
LSDAPLRDSRHNIVRKAGFVKMVSKPVKASYKGGRRRSPLRRNGSRAVGRRTAHHAPAQTLRTPWVGVAPPAASGRTLCSDECHPRGPGRAGRQPSPARKRARVPRARRRLSRRRRASRSRGSPSDLRPTASGDVCRPPQQGDGDDFRGPAATFLRPRNRGRARRARRRRNLRRESAACRGQPSCVRRHGARLRASAARLRGDDCRSCRVGRRWRDLCGSGRRLRRTAQTRAGRVAH